MSFDREIGAPFTLATLPSPINSTNGRTQAAGVHSISSSKKRKRTEIAVGVDGEGVLIYSVQSPQLQTSYALPPQTAFSIAPYSLYRKGNSKRPSCRFTYAAVQQIIPGEQPQLVCFTEEIKKDTSTDTVKSSYNLSSEEKSQVICIDSIPVSDNQLIKHGSHDVLVIFDTGRTLCLSSDLATVRWDTKLSTSSKDQRYREALAKIDHAVLTNGKAANTGLLRSRQDIAAILDPSLEANPEFLEYSPVLCVISRLQNQKRILVLFQVKLRSPDLITQHLPPLKHLLTWELPVSPSQPPHRTANDLFRLHASSGTLHEIVDGRLISFDFSGTIPRLYSDFAIPGTTIGSFQRISSDLILTVSAHSYGLFDSRYNSIQGLLSLSSRPNFAQGSSPKKRKQVEAGVAREPVVPPTLISYFAETGLAVAISHNELIGLQLGTTVARKRAKANASLLIDSIGKGVFPSAPGTSGLSNGQTSKEGQLRQEWLKKTHKLDKYVSKGKVADFERIFAAEIGITLENSTETQEALKAGAESSLLPNGTSDGAHEVQDIPNNANDQLRGWKLPRTAGSEKMRYQQQALYALSKIFSWVESDAQNKTALKIEFFPPNVFQWLLLLGYVTKESIRRATLESALNSLEKRQSLSDGDIVKAIVEFDPSLNILSAVLNHNQYLPAGEVTQAVKVLMQSLDDRPNEDTGLKLLTNGAAPEDEMDVDVASELEAATHDLDHALSILDNGLQLRSYTLRPALIRLNTFPAPVVISALRSTLPRRELESLIRLLHSELRNGGWTSPYDFIDSDLDATETGPEAPDDQAVAIIASLLSSALDAIGTGAWLATAEDLASEDHANDIISKLLQDTSETLNGFWEARYMRGLLSEFLRFAANSAKSQKPSAKVLQKQGKPFAADMVDEESLPMLPLGGKADVGVEKTKAGKGGKREERSAREIGMMISKRVPKYSFERIVV